MESKGFVIEWSIHITQVNDYQNFIDKIIELISDADVRIKVKQEYYTMLRRHRDDSKG